MLAEVKALSSEDHRLESEVDSVNVSSVNHGSSHRQLSWVFLNIRSIFALGILKMFGSSWDVRGETRFCLLCGSGGGDVSDQKRPSAPLS